MTRLKVMHQFDWSNLSLLGYSSELNWGYRDVLCSHQTFPVQGCDASSAGLFGNPRNGYYCWWCHYRDQQVCAYCDLLSVLPLSSHSFLVSVTLPPPNLSSPSQPDQGHDWEGGPISTQCHTSTLCHYRRKHVALLSSILYLQPSLFSCSLIFSSLSLFPLSSFPPPSSPLFTSFLSPPSLVLLFFFFLLFPFSFLPVSTSLSAFLPHCFISLSLSDDDDTSYWTLHEASYCW